MQMYLTKNVVEECIFKTYYRDDGVGDGLMENQRRKKR